MSSLPIRVLFVNDTSRNGGPGRSLHALLRHLDPALIHRTVVLPRKGEIADLLSTGAADELVFEPAWVENIVEPWRRPIARRDFEAPGLLRATRAVGNAGRMGRAVARLAARVRRGGYDLVYSNGTTADFVAGTLGALLRVPVIWHVRYTSVPAAAAVAHRLLAASAPVRRIICVSGAAAGLFDHCRRKVAVIHNGVDLSRFVARRGDGQRLRAALGLAPDTVVFGAHGRILRKKGFVEMLKAAHAALSMLDPGERRRCHFVVLGDTPQDFEPDHLDECRRLAAELGIERHVSFLGFRADVAPTVSGFDVAVVPSIYPDPLPRAVIEAMALGKPVVAFDVGGVAEMLGADEGTLLRGTPPDVEALAATFVRYLRDAALRSTQGAAARARALREFDARVHGQRVQGEILRALDAASVRAPGALASA